MFCCFFFLCHFLFTYLLLLLHIPPPHKCSLILFSSIFFFSFISQAGQWTLISYLHGSYLDTACFHCVSCVVTPSGRLGRLAQLPRPLFHPLPLVPALLGAKSPHPGLGGEFVSTFAAVSEPRGSNSARPVCQASEPCFVLFCFFEQQHRPLNASACSSTQTDPFTDWLRDDENQ